MSEAAGESTGGSGRFCSSELSRKCLQLPAGWWQQQCWWWRCSMNHDKEVLGKQLAEVEGECLRLQVSASQAWMCFLGFEREFWLAPPASGGAAAQRKCRGAKVALQ